MKRRAVPCRVMAGWTDTRGSGTLDISRVLNNSGPWARALAGAAGPFHFRGRNTRPTPSMANSHVSILMRQLQEKSAFFPNFYGVFVQRGGGDGPETRRAGGMSDGVMICTYKLTVPGLRAGLTP